MTNGWQINSIRFSKFVAARSIISRGTGFDEKSRTVCRLRIKSIDADELLKYAGRQLTSYKRPCEIVVLDAAGGVHRKNLQTQTLGNCTRREGAGRRGVGRNLGMMQ